ncbi:XrtN system VIT domain-containing protein [Carboxylicivirga taeanensis]|uniref:XrtN system VIT domain-containing protein n=1 Tax=Carboxylicivirga taeanensis TaxID=1416875 RepID=UPI003F6E3F6D
MKIRLTLAQQIGLVLLPIAMLIYYWTPQTQGTLEGWSLVNYLLAGAYFFISFWDKPANTNVFRLIRPRMNWHLLMALLLVSCFSLNKDIHVFASAPLWLELLLVPILLAFVFIAYPHSLPQGLRKGLAFMAGFGSLVLVYYAFVLLPTMLIAVIGLVLLGISIHLLVPLIMVVMSFRYAITNSYPFSCKGTFWWGFLTALLCSGIYIGIYAYQSQQIKAAQEHMVLNEANELPEWVHYAQKCQSSFWAKRIIGLGLLYEKHSDDWWGFNFNRGSFSEIREHDPLVACAGVRVPQLELSNEEAVKILSTSAQTRHYAYEKLWSGRDLRISKMLTDMRLYPDYRMAYAETTFWIENTNQREGNQQEALITFYLPEGTAASSLSLWIGGKEEKSRLTTRKNADRAYREVVGVERRDPVLLHWQEGNRLTATIFPCTPAEARRVKIGLTMPLKIKGQELVVESPQLIGPDNRGATEIIHLKCVGESIKPTVPQSFKRKAANQYLYKGRPLNHWEVRLPLQSLNPSQFVFNDQAYQLKNLNANGWLKPSAIYVDVNRQWEFDELESTLLAAQDVPVYVHHQGFVRVELSNVDALYKQLSKRPFSLFPVHKVQDGQSALLISKGQKNTPIPSELAPSPFFDGLKDCLIEHSTPLACLVLDGHKSDYIASLEQYKLLSCQTINIKELNGVDINRWFNLYEAEEDAVLLPDSQMAIVKKRGPHNAKTEEGAPTHLLRLYNYHAIIQKAGHLLLDNSELIDEAVYKLCNEAHIVSPVSSLIVLETIKDYERFGIDESTNSLKNASLKDSGAVPEPHEWALIAVVLAVILLMYFKLKI